MDTVARDVGDWFAIGCDSTVVATVTTHSMFDHITRPGLRRRFESIDTELGLPDDAVVFGGNHHQRDVDRCPLCNGPVQRFGQRSVLVQRLHVFNQRRA